MDNTMNNFTIIVDDSGYNALYVTFDKVNRIIRATCRTCMTSINFEINCNNFDVYGDQLIEYYKICDKMYELKKSNHDEVWNILGYAGSQFIEWLYYVKINLESNNYIDTKDNMDIIMLVFAYGVKIIKEELR